MNIVKRFYLCYLGNRRRTENNNDETEVKIFYIKKHNIACRTVQVYFNVVGSFLDV